MHAGIFPEIALILVIATVVAGIMQLLRQPIIIGHIITGLLVGPALFNLVQSSETADLFSHIGIALLLFIVGLGLNPRVIREVGKIAFLTGVGQILLTTSSAYLISRSLGFETVPSIYIGIALTFSSTIIVLKLLSDRKELNRLHGKIASGFLLLQDVIAGCLLIVVSSFGRNLPVGQLITQTAVRGGLLILGLTIAAVYILPKLSSFFARSPEFLFLFSLGWGLGVAALCSLLGFSIEIGALGAGVAIAASPYSYEISSRMRPLRDFFIILFFIVLGAGMSLDSIHTVLVPALILSAFILLTKPLIVLIVMGLQGFTKKTSFKAAITVSQISEFSLVLVILGAQLGHVSRDVVALITLISIITIAISTYLILYDDQIYNKLERFLGVFERRNPKIFSESLAHYDIVLFGYIAGSERFVKTFGKMGKRYLVVDYNPETIDDLRTKKIPCRYGDANDSEFLEELELDKVRLVVINITDFAANKLIVNHVRYHNKRAVIIAMNKSDKVENSLELYEDGASYVMMPHHQNSIRISRIIHRHGLSAKEFRGLKAQHTKALLNES